MFSFIASCFHRVLSGDFAEQLAELNSASKFIYRDELSKKQTPSKLIKNYYGVSFPSSKPLLEGHKDEKDRKRISCSDDAKAATIRVKVKMTKEEAARLLSKCKDGGIIEFRDVARELVNLPVHRVSIVSPCTGSNSVLYSIAEE